MKGDALKATILDYTGRFPRPFSAIYFDVCADYGPITRRSVQRALKVLMQRNLIVAHGHRNSWCNRKYSRAVIK